MYWDDRKWDEKSVDPQKFTSTIEEIKACQKNLLRLRVEDCGSFEDVEQYLSSLTKGLMLVKRINKDAVLIVDCLLVYFSRAIQFCKQKEVVDHSFEMHQYGSILRYIDEVHQTSSGAFPNAISILLKKILQFLWLVDFSAEIFKDWVTLVMDRPATLKSLYVIIESMLKWFPKTAQIIHDYEIALEDKCYEALRHSALANSASKCLSLYYRSLNDPQESEKKYFESWTPRVIRGFKDEITRDKVTVHLFPMLLRDIPDRFFIWIDTLCVPKSDPKWPEFMLPILQKGLDLSKVNDVVRNGLLLENEIEDLLCHPSEKVRLEVFILVCSSIHASSPPPKYACDIFKNNLILEHLIRELVSPDDRAVFVCHLRNALSKMRNYAEKARRKDRETEKVFSVESSCVAVFGLMHSMLIPDSSYAQLSTATEVIYFLITDEFDGISRSKKSGESFKLIDIFQYKLVRSLLRLTTNNYDDIRQKCSIMLEYCPFNTLESILLEQPPENSFNFLIQSKFGTTDSFSVFFKTIAQAYAKSRPDLYYKLLRDLYLHFESAAALQLPLSGSLAALSSVLGVSPQSIIDKHEDFGVICVKLLDVINQEWNLILQIVLSQDSFSSEESSSFWKTLKESAILIETLLDINNKAKKKFISQRLFLMICNNLMDQLASVTYRGAFSYILLAFIKCCAICFEGDLQQKPTEWLKYNLELVTTKKQKISRRSAGLPFLISGILVAAISQKSDMTEYLNVAFNCLLFTAKGEITMPQQSTLNLPQVNAFNCMTQIFKESLLKPYYQEFMGAALEAAFENLNNPAWVIKNSALMLTAALQNSFFGSNKLEDVVPGVKAELFFSQFPDTRATLLTHLRNLNCTSINEAIPILFILGRFEASSASKSLLESFQALVRSKYLSHKLWNIRELAASLIANTVPKFEVVNWISELIPTATTPPNEAHGSLLCILELLRRHSVGEMAIDDINRIVLSLKLSFKREIESQHFSRWFLLRLYIFILKEMDTSHAEMFEKLLNDCISQKNGLDGSAKLFVTSVIPVVLKDSERSEALSQKFFKLKNQEVLLATVEFWLGRVDQFQKIGVLHDFVLAVIESSSLSKHIYKKYLQLAVETKLSVPFPLNDKSWSPKCQCYSMSLQVKHADISDFTKKFLLFTRDDQPKDVRFQALSAAKELITVQTDLSPNFARLVFGIRLRESDESSRVRNLARLLDFDFDQGVMWTGDYIGRFGQCGRGIVLNFLVESLHKNIQDAKEELSNSIFDIERDNLFRNEIPEFVNHARVLFSTESNENLEPLVSSIENASHFILDSNRALVQSWTYNTHLDTIIRKLAGLDGITNIEPIQNACDTLLGFLRASKYPL